MIIFLLVVFFGSDPVGVILPQEFTLREQCLAVAGLITEVATPDAPARGVCVAKETKVKA